MSDNLYKSGKSSDINERSSSTQTPHGSKTKKGAGITLGILMFVGIILAITFLPGICNDQRQRELKKTGLPAKATITGIRDTGNRFNEQPEVELQLDVQASGLEPYKTSVKMYVSLVYLPQLQPGKIVNIKYDRKDKYKVVVDSVEN